MRNKFLLFIFLLSSFSTFGQAGTSITYQDEFGTVTLNYLDMINGKRRYRGNDGTANIDAYWTGSRWDIKYSVSDILYFSNVNTALNPPNKSIGNWQIGPNSGTAIIQFTGTGTTTAVLPVELIRFEGNKKEGRNLLTWQTASESQNKGFDIEHSTDGIRFEKIGFVVGKGTTSQKQEYSFNDEGQTVTTYYRLKQLDFDGRFEYSKIISIAQKGNNTVSVFPNPSKGIYSITGVENIEDETFVLINNIGQTLNLQVSNYGQFDISNLPSGLYYLRVASNGQVMKLTKE